jgi:hypothetical protein
MVENVPLNNEGSKAYRMYKYDYWMCWGGASRRLKSEVVIRDCLSNNINNIGKAEENKKEVEKVENFFRKQRGAKLGVEKNDSLVGINELKHKADRLYSISTFGAKKQDGESLVPSAHVRANTGRRGVIGRGREEGARGSG